MQDFKIENTAAYFKFCSNYVHSLKENNFAEGDQFRGSAVHSGIRSELTCIQQGLFYLGRYIVGFSVKNFA